jgi:hypothetical protein
LPIQNSLIFVLYLLHKKVTAFSISAVKEKSVTIFFAPIVGEYYCIQESREWQECPESSEWEELQESREWDGCTVGGM